MMNFTDQKLSAFLDGELSERETENVRIELAKNEQLNQRLEAIALVNGIIQVEVNQIDSRPLPETIIDQLAAAKTQPTFWNPLNTGFKQAMAASFLTLAALVMMTSLFTSNNFKGNKTDTQIGYVALDDPLHEALSGISSATEYQLKTSGALFTSILSFISNGGDFCREFTIEYPESSERSIACRENLNWKVLISTSSKNMAFNHGSYIPATSISPEGFELFANNLIKGSPLSREEEQQAIVAMWQAK